MNKTFVQCRCGHQVMAREVLRTDLYERPSGRDYIYVKFRCTRCKRLGQTFIPEAQFDWSSLESAADEMTAQERDRALEAGPISTGELMAFHAALKAIASVDQLQTPEQNLEQNREMSASGESSEASDKSSPPNARFAQAPRRRKRRRSNRERNDNSRGENPRNDARGDNADDEQNAANGGGDDSNAT